MVGRRARALRCARVARLDAAHPALPSRARRDPGRSPGTTLRRAAGPRLEPASGRARSHGPRSRTTTLEATGRWPCAPWVFSWASRWLLALVEAVSFEVRNRSNGTLVSSGQKREYLLHVPKSYDPAKPTPLVISMHGGAGWPAMQRDTSRWDTLADSQGFIVVYPSGMSGRGPRAWHMNRSGPREGRQVHLGSDRHPEGGLQHRSGDGSTRTGFRTAEAWRSSSPARCPTGSRPSGWWRRLSSCRSTGARTRRAVPMIAFHGTADRTVPYHGGKSWVAPVAVSGHADLGGRLGAKKRVQRRAGRVGAWRPTSLASSTRAAPTTRPWCSTP